MTKTERLEFIRFRYATLFGAPLTSNALEVAKLETARDRRTLAAIREVTRREERKTPLHIGFDKIESKKEAEGDYLLTSAEKKELNQIEMRWRARNPKQKIAPPNRKKGK